MDFEKIRNVANNKISRALATGLLVLAAKTSTATPETKGSNKESVRESSPVSAKTELNKETAYIVSGKELSEAATENNLELAKVDFDINYDTDKADLHEESKEEIVSQFATFLSDINNDNFKAIEKADWKVVSSCDERPTNAWGEKGNEALAIARGNAVISFLKGYLSSYEFSGLSKEQVEALKQKEIENSIVTTHEDRKGETLIQDIINPETGANYTESEIADIKENDQEKYLSLLAQNRISQFRAEIPFFKVEDIEDKDSKEPLKPIPELNPTLKKIEKTNVEGVVKMFPDYNNIVLLLDNSPSMVDDKKMLSKEIEENKADLTGKKLFIGNYSDGLKNIEEVTSDKAGEEVLKVIGSGSHKEVCVRSFVEAWNKIKEGISSDEKTLIVVNTDEAFQDISLEDIAATKSLPENVEVRFIMHMGPKEYLNIPLNMVQEKFDEAMNRRTLGWKNSLINVENQLRTLSERLLKTSDREEEKKINKMINNLEKRQKECIANIVEVNERFAGKNVNISQLKDENGDIIQFYIN